MARRGVKKPKVRPAIKPGSKAKVKRKVIKPRQVARREFVLEHRMAKKGKKPPVRYRRPVPKGMVKVAVTLKDKKLKTGYLMEFKYGRKQKPGQVGGWKNDPRPVIMLFHDDKIKYIEGVNLNYLSEWYVKKVRQIMNRFPGVDGEQLYNIFKRTAKFALKKGYRKYMRVSFRDMFLYVYENELQRTLDELAKSTQSDLGVADKANNPER